MTDVIPFASFLTTTINILYVALGLGLVIFFHELGHFAVAKWCGVHVERFSIGFGRPLIAWKWGDTEYWLAILPLGGYVKMLGQDDMDPSQLTSEEIAEDPRAYSNKSVPKRMAIISAGVIMNIVTAMLFYAFAYGFGVTAAPPAVGVMSTGMPAWESGLQTGWKITEINGRKCESFMDIRRIVALSSGDLHIKGLKEDGTPFEITVTPDGSGTRRRIGVGFLMGTRLMKPRDNETPVAAPGSAAGKAKPSFMPADNIMRIDDVETPDYITMRRVLAKQRDKEVTFHVIREGEKDIVEIKVPPNRFRTLGLIMDIGEIAAIRKGSPAEGKLKKGDRILEVDEIPIGKDLDPVKLPGLFEQKCRDRESVSIKVQRKGSSVPETVTITFTKDHPVYYAWTETPGVKDKPLSIPSLGVAFHMIAAVKGVTEDSPAAKAGIKRPDKGELKVTKMVLSLPEDVKDGMHKNGDYEVEFGKSEKDRVQHNWAHAFWMMQVMPSRTVTLMFSDDSEHTLTPAVVEDWSLPIRGIHLDIAKVTLKSEGPVDALQMGYKQTRDTISDTYLTIVRLFDGGISVKELSGPVGIAKVAYRVAEEGMPEFLMFLGFLSINLAVLNFLPIPVLDGGHMVFLMWEAVTRKKPSEKVMIGATYVGLAIVLGLMILVLYLDIFIKR